MILHGNPILRAPNEPIEIDPPEKDLDKLVKALYDAMDERNALGVAAPQIGVNKQMFVYNNQLTGDRGCFINPIRTRVEGNQTASEGCLSVPGVQFKLGRYKYVEISGYDEHLNPRTVAFTGLTAQIIQHELDHLDGKLIIDYLSRADRRKLKLKG